MNDREVDRRLKGCKLLFEMLRRSRLRAPSLAEFLKSAVDQVGRIQILHHFRSHDVALGEPEAHRAPRPQQNGIRQMASIKLACLELFATHRLVAERGSPGARCGPSAVLGVRREEA